MQQIKLILDPIMEFTLFQCNVAMTNRRFLFVLTRSVVSGLIGFRCNDDDDDDA